MAGKVLILQWTGSAYDALGGQLQLISQALAAEDFQPEMFVVNEPDWINRLVAELAKGGFAFALTMSGIGVDIRGKSGRLLWEAVKVPLFNWNCDHPCYFPAHHAIRDRFLLHGYVFPDHARYNIRYLNPNGAAFAVHIGMPPRSAFPGAPLPAGRRNGRIMFAKSGRDTDPIEARWNTNVPVARDIMFEAAEALFHRSTADFVPMLQLICERHGVLLDGNSELALALIRELDVYIRFKRGNLLVRTLLRHPVDVYGTGWEHLSEDNSATRFLGAAKWDDMMSQLPNYLGCLSMNPLVERSVHDRVFYGLAAGVAPSSDSNAFSRDHTPALECYNFTFTRERIEQALDTLLADPHAALDRAEATYQALSAEFTMRHAVRKIAQLAVLRTTNARAAP